MLAGLLLPALIAPALIMAAPAQEVQRRSTVYFGLDSVEVAPEAAPALDYIVRTMLAHPEMQARLSGHTDRTGTTEYNIAKSQRMAASVARYLSDHGVLEARITVIAYGEAKPAVPTRDDVREPMNRRVEIDLIGG
ncbi:OmpA family protein [Sphingomonas sp. HITSZ_GF]|uniref:OmpA family protein n=1 Tax=Sphingomonas sp. HITSZ_GF TaxID=3037247 RepID=UPI00240E7EA5|nr:OmpA family protein [Sphingomonas sp. HITSZ_GF]MDG2535462.1 OmpA family protein [Sphingomonas sp. HITSZ_GF]